MKHKKHQGFRTINQFTEQYLLRGELGAGITGSVSLAVHRKTAQICAVKVIRKGGSQAEQDAQLNKEQLTQLEQIKNNKVVTIYDLVEDKHNFYVV